MKKSILMMTCLFLAGCSSKEVSTPTPVVAVKVASAELADFQISVEAPATIFPRQQSNIAARLTAPIRRLHVKKGDSVKAGQILAELDDGDLLAQKREAVAVVADAEANLQKTSGGTLPTDIERAKGQLTTAEAALNQAQKNYDRRLDLFDKGAIPNRDLLASQTDLSEARAAYDVAKKSLDLLLTQSREKDIAIAESRVEQAKARLQLLDTQLQFTKIASSFAGVVAEQFMYPGDMAKPDAPIFTVIDLTMAVARAQVPESEAGGIRIGQPSLFSSTDSPGSVYKGKITVVNRTVDPARRTVEVWAEIPGQQRELRSGVFGRLKIITGTVPGSVLVPLAAVQFQEGTRKGSVMVVDQKSVAHKRDVETGEQTGDKVRIVNGIARGELVIVEGGYGLPDGTQVRSAEEKKK
jgi:HlyD family secretion protein